MEEVTNATEWVNVLILKLNGVFVQGRIREGQGLFAIPTKRRVRSSPDKFVPDKGNRAIVEENRYHQDPKPNWRARDLSTQNSLWEVLTNDSLPSDADSAEISITGSKYAGSSLKGRQSQKMYEVLQQDPPYSVPDEGSTLKSDGDLFRIPQLRCYNNKSKTSDAIQEALVHDFKREVPSRRDYMLPNSRRHGSSFHNTHWDTRTQEHFDWESNTSRNGGVFYSEIQRNTEAANRLKQQLSAQDWVPRGQSNSTTESRENFTGAMRGGPRHAPPRRSGKKMHINNHANPWSARTHIV